MEKKNNFFLIVSLIIVSMVAVLFYFFYFMMGNLSNPEKGKSTNENVGEAVTGSIIIEIKDSIFTPSAVVIKKGTVVTWVNRDEQQHVVASDPHPTHTDLPGLYSNKMKQNQSFSYTYESVGTFGYHCHDHPNMKGKVIVKE